MLIDWFTVIAQLVNFFILVWLMKRFLYKPILNAIDAREARIAAELAHADKTRLEATQQREQFQKKNEELDQQRAELLRKATAEAAAERHRLLEEAAEAADKQRAKRRQSLEREEQSLSDEITRRTHKEVFAIARKTLTDLAGESLEARMVEMFTQRLREMSDNIRSGLAKVINTSSDPAVVRCAFDLASDQQAAIQRALNETFKTQVPVRFNTAPDVISGIELTIQGQKLAWSIADYLVSLEDSVHQLLKTETESKAKPQAKSQTDSQPQSGTETAPSQEAK